MGGTIYTFIPLDVRIVHATGDVMRTRARVCLFSIAVGLPVMERTKRRVFSIAGWLGWRCMSSPLRVAHS
jgi:hypothetical protein